MLDKRGPKIERSGTPDSMSFYKLYELCTRTLCFLFDKQLWINFKACKVKPYAFSFAVRSSWQRQSNALERSVGRSPKILPLSTAFFAFF